MPWLASHSVSWPRLDTHGVCPTSRRQWADFLVSLMAPLHRQYKTARTETRWHLLFENRADADSDSGFARLCFVRHKDGIYAICCLVPQGIHTKVLKLSAGLRTQSVECSKLGKTRIIADAVTGWLEMPHFLNRMFHRHSTRNRRGMLLIILVIRVKNGMFIAAVPFSI